MSHHSAGQMTRTCSRIVTDAMEEGQEYTAKQLAAITGLKGQRVGGALRHVDGKYVLKTGRKTSNGALKYKLIKKIPGSVRE